MLTVEEINDDGAWNEFVESTPSGTIFHTSLWLNKSPHRFLRLVTHSGKTIVGGAVVQRDENGAGTLGTLAPYLGPIYSADISASGCRIADRLQIGRTFAVAIRERVPNARFFSSPWVSSIEPFINSGFAGRLLYTMVIDISDLSHVWENFASKLRSNIRAAEKAGLSITETSDSKQLLDLVRKTFARQRRQPWFSLEEAASCWESLAQFERARAFVTHDRTGRCIATAGLVWDNRRSYYLLGGYDENNTHRGASSLALWHAIQFASRDLGLKSFDLEGSHIPAICRFFHQFGGKSIPYYLVWADDKPLFSQERDPIC
jgi:hypothetical protein